MGFKMKGPSMNISYGGESNKQQKSNLLKDNPVAKHASAMNMDGDAPLEVTEEGVEKVAASDANPAFKNALNKNRKSTRVFYVPNLECSVVLEKRNFSKVLTTAIVFYENQEDYKKCSELVKLKKQIDE